MLRAHGQTGRGSPKRTQGLYALCRAPNPTFAFSANLSGPSLGSCRKKGLRLSTHFEDRSGKFSEEVAGAEASLAGE